MDSVSISELRQHIAEYVEQVHAGAEIIVTRGGEPVARMVPVVDRRQEAESYLARLRKTAVVGDVVSPVFENDWDAMK
jgi:prevent-host-death family protein